MEGSFLYNVVRNSCAVFLYTYSRLRASGRHNIPRCGGFIMAANHVSYLDPPALAAACPRHMSYMGRDTLFGNRFLGWVFKNVSVFPLKRNSADFGALKEALRRLKNGDGLLLFPEGTRSPDGKIARGLAGVAFLARKSGVPVVPARVDGSERAMPKTSKWIAPFRIRVVFGEPFVFRQGKYASDQDFVAEVMSRIAALKPTVDNKGVFADNDNSQ
ncbi:MAG: lysophospholipid acyltransferase family protein [Candidatus Omnitrophota bacterium]